jgi:hypothetical protein
MPTDWFARYVVELNDEDVQAWAKENEEAIQAALEQSKDGFEAGCPIVSEIRFAEGAEGEPSAEEALKRLRSKLRTAADFQQAARQLSTADSADLGGLVGCLDQSYGPTSEVLLSAIAGLDKEGAVSEVIPTVLGPTLVRIEGFVTAENRGALQRNFLARKLATQARAKQKAEEYARALIARLSAGESLEEANAALIDATLAKGAFEKEDSSARSSAVRPTTDISRQFSIEQSPLPDAVGEVPVAKLVFDLEEVDDVVKEPIETRRGLAVLQLKDKDLATREDFAEDRDRVTARLRARKSEEILAQLVADLIEGAGGVKINRSFIPEETEEESSDSAPSGS